MCATAIEQKGAHLMTPTDKSGLTKTAPKHVHTQEFAYLDILHLQAIYQYPKNNFTYQHTILINKYGQ